MASRDRHQAPPPPDLDFNVELRSGAPVWECLCGLLLVVAVVAVVLARGWRP